MTETETTYKTEELLPECETGSVERMLEAAIEWNRGIASDMVFDMAPHDVRLLRDRQDSQTKLLRNILAKMLADDPPLNMRDVVCQYKLGEVTLTAAEAKEIERRILQWGAKEQAPARECGDGPPRHTATTHRQVCPNCNAWLRIESKLYG